MKYDDELIDRIRSAADIVETVGEYVELRRKGSNYVGLCPFHNEKTPSFTLSADKGIYKCFGCGKSGNVFSFMMDYHRMSFTEAVETLARKAGIQISEKSVSGSDKVATKRDLVLKILNEAAHYYNKILKQPEGRQALAYCRKRAFDDDLISRFLLGYAPDSWDSTSNTLKKLGYTEDTLLDAGLTIKRDDGRQYDRFRGRLIFPIRDYMGRIVGFGARRMDENQSQPKYINSPQTIVYDKSKTLYGLYEGKHSLRNQRFAILVEGYADVLTLHRNGFEYAVASSGTSLTVEQLKLISRYVKSLYFVYDADSAGQAATERGIELAVEQGFDTHIIKLPKGEDPDSLVRRHGKAVFDSYLSEPMSFVEFKAERLRSAGMLDSPASKAEAARQIIRIIARIPDRLQHDFYMQKIASIFDLTESQLREIYHEKSNIERNEQKSDTFRSSRPSDTVSDGLKPQQESIGQDIAGQDNRLDIKSMLPEEMFLLKIILNAPEKLAYLIKKQGFNPQLCITGTAKALFRAVIDFSGTNKAEFNNIYISITVEENIRDALSSIALGSEQPSDKWGEFSNISEGDNLDKCISDSVTQLRLVSLDECRKAVVAQYKQSDGIEAQLGLLNKIKEIDTKKEELKASLLSFVPK